IVTEFRVGVHVFAHGCSVPSLASGVNPLVLACLLACFFTRQKDPLSAPLRFLSGNWSPSLKSAPPLLSFFYLLFFLLFLGTLGVCFIFLFIFVFLLGCVGSVLQCII
ncbi:MAG: hypothetical protein ACO39G_07845, partial [Flavobacteriaceae bacterium]